MTDLNINEPVNTQLVESLVQVIRSLSPAEQALLQSKLLTDIPYPSNNELAHLIESSGSLDFLYDEPDIYTTSQTICDSLELFSEDFMESREQPNLEIRETLE